MGDATGYVYDPLFLEHDLTDHPESSARLTAIVAELSSAGLLARMQPIPARPADDALLSRVHDPGYIDHAQISKRLPDPDTYLSAGRTRRG